MAANETDLNRSPEERRSEQRYPCTGEARIFDAESGEDLGEGILSDISSSGASVHVYCPLRPGSMIELRQGTQVYRGEIRYCKESGADFRLGVQLIPPEQWSPNRAWPRLS